MVAVIQKEFSFKDIKEYQEQVKIYQVSKDETLGVQVSLLNDPQPLDNCTYSFTLFPKRRL